MDAPVVGEERPSLLRHLQRRLKRRQHLRQLLNPQEVLLRRDR
jgi:hypothetical protein